MNILASGKANFGMEVSYKIIETGQSDKKPLLIYLHGFNQNIEQFQGLTKELLSLEAYHLFIEGPYPIYDRTRKKKVAQWGRAWYLYDGEQDQFKTSLEITSQFIQKVIDSVKESISVSRVALLGYSMGGYQAGYFALSRWQHINELVVIGGRIKTEVFEGKKGNYEHMNILALHGSKDKSVKSSPQQKSCDRLRHWGANVTFEELDESHSLNEIYINKVYNWFLLQGYN